MAAKTQTKEGASRTRAEEQRHVNDMYANGSLTRGEWKYKTDELSDLSVWAAEGKVKK